MESPQEGAPQRLLLRIPEVAEMLGIGRTKIYELIATGELPTIRVGRAVRISVRTLQEWVEACEQQRIVHLKDVARKTQQWLPKDSLNE